MKRLPFVIWTMGWPFLGDLAHVRSSRVYSDDTEFFAAVVMLLIWICVATMLWKDENPKVEDEEEQEAS